ncbi:MAG TPA: 5-formyltetrahydrofolate cyclo-ligase, partial [Mycobacteriales bacterium]|nr:5-formyltetrahydrofolate cyclo-ligase [Mycobacteriales bacterium]
MEAKRLLRTRLLAARAARPPAEIAAAGAALAAHAAAAWRGRTRVAGFAAVGTEPPTRPLLDVLRESGGQVLLPVVAGQSLRWAPYEGWDALRPGQWDLLEPAGTLLPPDALVGIDVVLAPALAVDLHGHRLGRG